MPRNLSNWNYGDVVSFLKQHFFEFIEQTIGSHFYYQGRVDGKIRLVDVQSHGSRSISIKSLQHDIITKSGIPEIYWKNWANAGNKKLRKTIQYEGAVQIN